MCVDSANCLATAPPILQWSARLQWQPARPQPRSCDRIFPEQAVPARPAPFTLESPSPCPRRMTNLSPAAVDSEKNRHPPRMLFLVVCCVANRLPSTTRFQLHHLTHPLMGNNHLKGHDLGTNGSLGCARPRNPMMKRPSTPPTAEISTSENKTEEVMYQTMMKMLLPDTRLPCPGHN